MNNKIIVFCCAIFVAQTDRRQVPIVWRRWECFRLSFSLAAFQRGHRLPVLRYRIQSNVFNTKHDNCAQSARYVSSSSLQQVRIYNFCCGWCGRYGCCLCTRSPWESKNSTCVIRNWCLVCVCAFVCVPARAKKGQRKHHAIIIFCIIVIIMIMMNKIMSAKVETQINAYAIQFLSLSLSPLFFCFHLSPRNVSTNEGWAHKIKWIEMTHVILCAPFW